MESKDLVQGQFAVKSGGATLKELVARFATASRINDLDDQLMEAIPDLKINEAVAKCDDIIIEQLVSRIIDLVVQTRLTKQTLPYYLVGLCSTLEMGKRAQLAEKIQSGQQTIAKLEQLQYVLPVQQDQDSKDMKKNSISPKLTNTLLALCFSFAHDLIPSRSRFRQLSSRAYRKSCDMQYLKMHRVEATPERMLKHFAEATIGGEWVKTQYGEGNHYVVDIANFDAIKKMNPLVVDKIDFKFAIKIKPNFPGCITQIMIHTICEQHDKQVTFNQKCVLDIGQGHRELDCNANFDLDLSNYTMEQRSTLKIYTFWALQYSAKDATDDAVKVVNKDGGSHQYHNLSEHRMLAYWKLVK